MVVSNFIRQALVAEPLTIFGDGAQTRSFCYVTDLIDGLVRLTQTGADVTGPVNLGNPVEFSIAELAEKVIEITGSRSVIKKLPLPEDDPRQRQPDISSARALLDWTPKVSLDEGLRYTVDYFDAFLANRRQSVSELAPAAATAGANLG